MCSRSVCIHVDIIKQIPDSSMTRICRAIEIELQLKNTREARWMFNKALASLPVHARLWMEVSVLCVYMCAWMTTIFFTPCFWCDLIDAVPGFRVAASMCVSIPRGAGCPSHLLLLPTHHCNTENSSPS